MTQHVAEAPLVTHGEAIHLTQRFLNASQWYMDSLLTSKRKFSTIGSYHYNLIKYYHNSSKPAQSVVSADTIFMFMQLTTESVISNLHKKAFSKNDNLEKSKNVQCELKVSCVIFGYNKSGLMILLNRRPDVAAGSLFMGNINREESCEAALRRVLLKETGLSNFPLEQLHCFSTKPMEKKCNTILLTYISLLNAEDQIALPDTKWFSIKKQPRLQQVEKKIIDQAYAVLQYRMSHYPISVNLLPDKFTMSRLYQIYQVIYDCSLDRRNFKNVYWL